MKRSRLTVKARVTLWYTALVCMLTGVLLWALVFSMVNAGRKHHEELLLRAMASTADEVYYFAGRPGIRSYDIEDFDKVIFSLYDTKGNLWYGFEDEDGLPFEDGTVRYATHANGKPWIVQDLLLPFEEGDVWLRGHLAMDAMMFMENQAIHWIAFAAPGLILVAMLGGYLLTRRAFRPVVTMAHQAEAIVNGQDLSQRFETPDEKHQDEFGHLADAFNHMFGRLEESFKRERQFTDDASHELRTPIAVIKAACDYALGQEDPEEYREALETVREKAEGMNAMVAQLLQMARMDSGRIVLAKENVDFSELCVTLAQEMQLRSDKMLDVSGVEAGIMVEGDELLLMRLVMNLLDNAFKFARSQVQVTLQKADNMAVLQVRDDGPGMTEEVAKRVFDRFYQAAGDRSASKPGAGLGLSMAKQIAQLHQAELSVETQEGVGADFILKISAK